jgi:uncharacterized protein YdaU (DUF1376 family)
MLEYPSYQSYPNDWLLDSKTLTWNMELMGCYHQLIDHIWISGGRLEFSQANLKAIWKYRTRTQTLSKWNEIKCKFVLSTFDGITYITHKRIDKERKRLIQQRLKKQGAGRLGGLQKAENFSNAIAEIKPLPSPSITSSITPTVTREKENISPFFNDQPVKEYHPESMDIIHAWLKAIGGDITTARQLDLDRIDEYVRNPKYGPELVRKVLLEVLPVRPGSILAKLDFAASDKFHDESKKIDDIDYAAEYKAKKEAASG